jgi:hypothetical protein
MIITSLFWFYIHFMVPSCTLGFAPGNFLKLEWDEYYGDPSLKRHSMNNTVIYHLLKHLLVTSAGLVFPFGRE